MNETRTTKKAFIIFAFIALTVACKKEKATDAENSLFSEVTAGGYTYYQGGNILSAAGPSPHSSFKLRFNGIANAALDSTGEIPIGSNFPNGSIIVKEVQNGGSTTLYAIMKKDASNPNAGNGWLWSEIRTDGSVVFGTDNKGVGCISCHSGTPNRDLVRTFDLH